MNRFRGGGLFDLNDFLKRFFETLIENPNCFRSLYEQIN